MTDWEKIVSQHVGVVWRVVHRLVGNHADAWDCVQETFLEAVKIDRREVVRDCPGAGLIESAISAASAMQPGCRRVAGDWPGS